MDSLMIRSLAAGVGGIVGVAVGLWRGKLQNDKYPRKVLMEVAGAAVAGALSTIPTLPGEIVAFILLGLAWSQLCQWLRVRNTESIHLAAKSMWNWLESGKPPGDVPAEIRTLAVRWPAFVWLKIFHYLGFSNLSDEQIAAYGTYRAQIAWDIGFGQRLNENRRWIRRRGWPPICLAVAGTLVYYSVLVFETHFLPSASTYVIQAVVILLLFLCVPDPSVDAFNMPDDADAALCFYGYWCAFQISWVLLYLGFFGAAISPTELSLGSFTLATGRQSPLWQVSTHFLNNLNSLYLIMCYCVLRDPPSLSSKHDRVGRLTLALGSIVVALTAVETACYWCGWMRHIGYFTLIGAFAGGVGLALLVGRLESTFLGVPVWPIALLYWYAVIQGAMAAFGATEDLERSVLALTLPLKCLLLLLVAWIAESDLLINYMRQMRGLKASQEQAREEKLHDGGST